VTGSCKLANFHRKIFKVCCPIFKVFLNKMAPEIALLLVPSDVGSVYPGKSRAPAALKTAGLVEKLEEKCYMVLDYHAFSATKNSLANSEWKASSTRPNGARHEKAAVAVYHGVKDSIAIILDGREPAENGNEREPTAKIVEPFVFVLGGECLIVPSILSAMAANYHQGNPLPPKPQDSLVGLL
jgi:arginase